MDAQDKLSQTTVAFHWFLGVSIIALIAFGIYVENLADSPQKGDLIGIHVSVGVLVFGLAAFRMIWRIKNGLPEPLTPSPRWQELTAKSVHVVLLAGTVLLPISGVMMSVGGGHGVAVFGVELIAGLAEKDEILSQVGHVVHEWGGKLMIAAILLHVVGALKHHFVDKDATLLRMFGRRV